MELLLTCMCVKRGGAGSERGVGGGAAVKSVFLCFSMITIIQVVNLPERTETVLITKSN